MKMVVSLEIYESDRKAPKRANAQVAPIKLVTMVEELATPVCMVPCKYVTSVNMFGT